MRKVLNITGWGLSCHLMIAMLAYEAIGWPAVPEECENTNAALAAAADMETDTGTMIQMPVAGATIQGTAAVKPSSLDPTTCIEAVLVEPRALNYTAVPLQSALGVPGIGLITLAHGRDNGLFSKQLVDGNNNLAEAYECGMLRLLPLPVTDLGGGGVWHHEYTRLLVSHRFWDLVHCNRVLIFQSDTVFCRDSPVSINEFAEFPYVGGQSPGMDGGPDRIHMNGGFSLRSRPAMLECIQHEMHDAVLHSGYGEDEIFSRCRSLKQPPTWLVDRFAIDNAAKMPEIDRSAIDNAAKLPSLTPPLGVHKPWAGPFAQYVTQLCSGAKELTDAVEKEVHL